MKKEEENYLVNKNNVLAQERGIEYLIIDVSGNVGTYHFEVIILFYLIYSLVYAGITHTR